ncbi:MAG: SMP-30/gluconolactonase/LRE family protein [Thermoleophilaceae bacterium]
MTTRVAAVDAHEGPVFVQDENAVYFTSVPRRDRAGDPTPIVAIKRLDLGDRRVSIVQAEANVANGMTLDPSGCLLVCEQGTRSRPARISRFDCAAGRLESVVDSWNGSPLNSPNDVVVKSDGTIWFTDPSYGFIQGFRPEPRLGDNVYRYDPATGQLELVADSLDKPNGLAFAPAEDVLYVGDSGEPHHVKAFDVRDGRRLANERLFAVIEPGYPDGLKTDAAGRVFVSSLSGVQIFTPAGRKLGRIPVPGAVNFAFGDGALFITNDTAIWKADLEGDFAWTQ